MSRSRVVVLEILLFLFSAVIIGRLFYWQILKHSDFTVAAQSQIENTVQVGAKRGKIFAADGSILVSNQRAFLMYSILPEIRKLRQKDESYDDFVKTISEKIAPILLKEKIAVREKVSQSEKDNIWDEIRTNISFQLHQPKLIWVPLAKKINEDTKKQIEAFHIKGIGFEEDTERFYPEGNLAANLLGFVGKDNKGDDKGYFGLEGYYDDKLRGRVGTLIQEVDALGRPILAADPEGLGTLNGMDLHTTIDRTAQYVLDKKIKEGVERYGAKSGAALILNPRTGALIASSSFPTFNLADPSGAKNEYFKNLGVGEVYEPGSTFKSVTFSAALDSGSIQTSTICPCKGPIKAAGFEVQTFDNKYHPNSTITQILQHSDNVGAAFAAQKMGIDVFLKYIKDFGFGASSGIDLQGEETGIIKNRSDWNEIELVTAAFGQGLSVTPLQMVTALAAISNDGVLMKPYVVQKITSPKGEVDFSPKKERQVIKSSTAATMRQLLLAAVEGGEAKRLIPHGYRVAGKTGTAQVPVAGRYSTKTVASFVGFGPAEDPRFTMIVALFEPSASIFAADTAEPLFFKIIEELYPYWGIPVSK
ncbi:MAG: penicillin-binding protein 2 [bacterium]|nr:penicillin-binding protein 2 [bacterium]